MIRRHFIGGIVLLLIGVYCQRNPDFPCRVVWKRNLSVIAEKWGQAPGKPFRLQATEGEAGIIKSADELRKVTDNSPFKTAIFGDMPFMCLMITHEGHILLYRTAIKEYYLNQVCFLLLFY